MPRCVRFADSIAAGLVLALALLATPLQAAPYRGEGGILEAFGVLTGTYSIVESALTTCAQNAQLRARANEARDRYAMAVVPIYWQARVQLYRHALRSGGPEELRRLREEVASQVPIIAAKLGQQISALAKTPGWCDSIVKEISGGLWDLDRRNARHLARIFSPGATDTRPFVRGLIDGCVDKNVDALRKQGQLTKSTTERTLFYCLCAAPFNAYEFDKRAQGIGAGEGRSVSKATDAGRQACLTDTDW